MALSSLSIAVKKSAKDLLALRIKHSRIEQLMNELQTLLYPGSQDSLLLVCGPTGAGKTTLARHMVENKLACSKHAMEADVSIIPAAYVEAPASGENDFSWRLLYQRILLQLEAGVDLPKYPFGVNIQTGYAARSPRARAHTLAGLRTAVERALRERGTEFLVIDEAAHIIRQTRPNRLEIQLDTLKSIANECGVQIMLVGAYDLYQLVSLSGQLARRTHVLHFERYRQDREEDIKAFQACVKYFQTALPELWSDQLLPHATALHENTLGCVGTLSGVLTRAAMLAQAQGQWTQDALARAVLTAAQRKQILQETLEGEDAINPSLTRAMSKSARSDSAQRRSV